MMISNEDGLEKILAIGKKIPQELFPLDPHRGKYYFGKKNQNSFIYRVTRKNRDKI